MKESTIVDRLVARFRANGDEVFKLNDGSTAGIPDVARIGGGSTAWIEVKYLRQGKKLTEIVEPAQVTTGLSLWQRNHERMCFAVYSVNKASNPGLTLWAPWKMLQQFRTKEPIGFGVCDGTIVNVAEQLRTIGAARISTLNDRFVERWLADLDTIARYKVEL
jgi:hypothetical protein